jgi:AraC-like DNA-binding protein
MLIAIYALTHYLTVYSKSAFWMALFYNNISPFMLLPGPFLYFYIRGTLDDRQGLRWKDSIHFIPAFIQFIGMIPYYFSSFSYKVTVCKLIISNVDYIKKIQWNLFFDYKFNFIFRLVILIFYVILSIILLWKFYFNKKKHENIPYKQYSITFRWMLSLLGLIVFLLTNYIAIVYYFLQYNSIELIENVIYINSTALVSFIFLVLSLLFFPEILYGMQRPKKEKKKTVKKKTRLTPLKITALRENGIDDEPNPFLELYEKINFYLINEKPYLNPKFTIAQISLDLGVPQNHVSYCINSLFNTTFSKLRTKLRIEQTIVYLNEAKYSQLTIDGVAQMVGFTSRSSFYNAFKEKMGITPSEYLKEIEQQMATKKNRSN